MNDDDPPREALQIDGAIREVNMRVLRSVEPRYPTPGVLPSPSPLVFSR